MDKAKYQLCNRLREHKLDNFRTGKAIRPRSKLYILEINSSDINFMDLLAKDYGKKDKRTLMTCEMSNRMSHERDGSSSRKDDKVSERTDIG